MELKTKYNIGQKVYVETENGTELKKIDVVYVYVDDCQTRITYGFKKGYNMTVEEYQEYQIMFEEDLMKRQP